MPAGRFVLTGSLVGLSVCAANAQVVHWPREAGGNGHAYELVTASVTPAQARAGAAGRVMEGVRGHLAAINSPEETAFLLQAFGGAALQGALIGGTQGSSGAEPDGGWRWHTGEAFLYTNWQAGQPDDNGGDSPSESELEFGPSGAWNDIFPTVVRGKYLVEYGGPAPVAAYPFEGDYQNAAADSYHGLPQGGLSAFDLGAQGLAARFDGVDDWLRVNHGGGLTFDLDDESFSFSVWVKAETPQTGYQPTVFQDRYGSDVTTTNLVVRPDHPNGNINCDTWYGAPSNAGVQSFYDEPVYRRGWIHIVCTFDADLGLKMLYVDGRLVDMDLRPNLPFVPNIVGVMTIGGGWYPGGMTNFYRGLVDELRFYNVALSPQEVAELYQPKCPADLTGSSDPNDPSYGVPNGIVDADDFFYYLDLFTLSCP